MYRDEVEALRERVNTLESQLGAMRARAVRAEARLDAIAAGEPDPAAAARLPSVRVVAGLLMVVSLFVVALMVAFWPVYMTLAHTEPTPDFPPMLQGAMMATVVDLLLLPVLVTSLAGAIGLWRGRTWGYVAALASCCLSCLGCLPIGVIGFALLLRREVRAGFLPPLPAAREPSE